jgi:hypothetical protein
MSNQSCSDLSGTTTFSIMIFSIMTLRIMTLNIMDLIVALSINYTQHKN